MRSFFSMVAFLLCAEFASAQEAYTLKFKLEPEAGKAVVYKSSNTDTGTMKMINTETKEEADIKPEGKSSELELTVIATDRNGKPTIFAKKYEKSNKRENGKTTIDSVEGKTLYWEMPTNGKARIGIAGENTIDKEEYAKLIEKLELPSEFAASVSALDPGKPVKFGDTWKFDMAKLAKLTGMVIDEKKSSGKVKFTKVEKVGDTVFGTFKIDFVAYVKKVGIHDPIEFVTPIEFSSTIFLRAAIDGSTTHYEEQSTLAAKGTTDLAPASLKLRAEFDVKGEKTTTRSAEKPATIKTLPAKLTYLPAPGDWVAVAPKDAGFKALMPGAPKAQLSENRETVNDMWMLEMDMGQLTYIVGKATVAKAGVTGKTVADSIEMKNKGATVTEIKIAGETAYELIYTSGKIEFYHRIVIKDGVLWQAVVGAAEGKSTKQDREKFFKSFEIEEKK